MKIRVSALLVFLIVPFLLAAKRPALGQTATFKQDATGHGFIDVTIPAALQGTPPELIVQLNKLDAAGNPVPPPVTKTVVPKAIIDESGKDTISFSMPVDTALLANTDYQLGISLSGIRWLEIKVDRRLTPDFSIGPGRQCTGGISLVLSGPSGDIDNPAEAAAISQFWSPIFTHVQQINASKNQGRFVQVSVSAQGHQQIIGVNSLAPDDTVTNLKALALAGKLPFCIDPSTKPPAGDFGMTVQSLPRPKRESATGAGERV
jgi:hypothetical protein